MPPVNKVVTSSSRPATSSVHRASPATASPPRGEGSRPRRCQRESSTSRRATGRQVSSSVEDRVAPLAACRHALEESPARSNVGYDEPIGPTLLEPRRHGCTFVHVRKPIRTSASICARRSAATSASRRRRSSRARKCVSTCPTRKRRRRPSMRATTASRCHHCPKLAKAPRSPAPAYCDTSVARRPANKRDRPEFQPPPPQRTGAYHTAPCVTEFSNSGGDAGANREWPQLCAVRSLAQSDLS